MMTGPFSNIELNRGEPNQAICDQIIELILQQKLTDGALPAPRVMAKQVGAATDMIAQVYQQLVSQGYLVKAADNSYQVSQDIQLSKSTNLVKLYPDGTLNAPKRTANKNESAVVISQSGQQAEWSAYEYPFVCDQFGNGDIPSYQIQKCAQSAVSMPPDSATGATADCPELIEQIRQQLLTRRALQVSADEILITASAEKSQQLLASYLADSTKVFGFENPTHSNCRQLFAQGGAQLAHFDVDEQGLVLSPELASCDYLWVSPANQYPTTVTMSQQRRQALLARATIDGFVIIENDHQSDMNFIERAQPALKSLDQANRVIYSGSLSGSLSAELSIGYIVADKFLINQLRTLQSALGQQLSAQRQRIAADFLTHGFYDNHVARLRHSLESKWVKMVIAVEQHLPDCDVNATPGSLWSWLKLPQGLSSQQLIAAAQAQGIYIESSNKLFSQQIADEFIALGFTAIAEPNIDSGLAKLGALIKQLVVD